MTTAQADFPLQRRIYKGPSPGYHETMDSEKPLIAPSLLSADFSRMGEALCSIESSGADWVHLDVMDGQFVPNLTFGPKMIADLRPHSKLPFDVHLMTETPDRLASEYIQSGATYLSWHIEACVHSHRLSCLVREQGAKPGISLVPSTPVSMLHEILWQVDQVLVMTVNPGFGGQVLIERCVEKVKDLLAIRKERGLEYLIAVDGGINEKSALQLIQAGADVLVTGSSFFTSDDKTAYIRRLKGRRASRAD